MSTELVDCKCNSTVSTWDDCLLDGSEDTSDLPCEAHIPALPTSSTRRARRESGILKYHPSTGTWVKSSFGPGFVSELSARQGQEFAEVTFVGGGSVLVSATEIAGKELLPDQCTGAGRLLAFLLAPSMICAGHRVKHTRHVHYTVPKPEEEEAKMRRRPSMRVDGPSPAKRPATPVRCKTTL
eukprot:CAMPEP_0204364816 /NCGR_PEP_ID=MMETSP0469-20131031/41434_1 /ASSEMBLY_ACC=CAM_ASM_000384 /TAXON_ID=2969 /ORGANISM="Oxyrrhis marina" /LENGTH=182 /DNA_ID=CAMNT_0051353793 /DNA_START=22 /DNA_END=570 /DNA_ORIENTATION=+